MGDDWFELWPEVVKGGKAEVGVGEQGLGEGLVDGGVVGDVVEEGVGLADGGWEGLAVLERAKCEVSGKVGGVGFDGAAA